MARRAARFSLLVAIGLALLVAVLAGHKVLSSREEGRAHAPQPSQPPAAESSLDGPAGAPSAGAGTSDRERILAWVARCGGKVSFDPVERFLEWADEETTWYDEQGSMPPGDVTAVRLQAEDLDEALARLPDGVTIPVLELHGWGWSAPDLTPLKRVRGLRGLEANCHITDAAFAPIGELTGLEALDLWDNPITDAAFVHLGRLAALRRLDLSTTKIAGEAALALPETLEVLHLRRTGIGDRFVELLPPLPNLTVLGLASTGVGDAAMARVGSFTALRDLDVHETSVGDAGAMHLRRLTNLESLDLASNYGISDLAVAALAPLSRLQELYLHGTRVATLKGIEGLSQLRTLSLAGTEVGDEALSRIAAATGLRFLGLRHTRITDEGLKHMGSLRELRTLYLSETRITGAGLSYLRGLEALEDVQLWHTGVDDAGLQNLTSLHSLREIHLQETRVTIHGLLGLKTLPNLRDLRISRLSDEDAARLAAAIPRCGVLMDR